MDEHRTSPRRRLLKSGKISFGGGAIDCTVRNFSETGAALDVTSPVGIPDHFTLLIESKFMHLAKSSGGSTRGSESVSMRIRMIASREPVRVRQPNWEKWQALEPFSYETGF